MAGRLDGIRCPGFPCGTRLSVNADMTGWHPGPSRTLPIVQLKDCLAFRFSIFRIALFGWNAIPELHLRNWRWLAGPPF
jgi:hypothetical protein